MSEGQGGPSGFNFPRPNQPPAGPNPFQTALSALMAKIGEVNPGIFGLGETLVQRGMGTEEDPVIAAQRGGAVNQLMGTLGRRGFANSTIGQNAVAGLNKQYDLASVARQDELLKGGIGLQTLGLQNMTAVPQLLTAQTAAENAGKGGGGGGGGLFGTVICTLLYARGDLPPDIYRADVDYGVKHVSTDTLRGYRAWAAPLVGLAQERPAVYVLVRFLGRRWAYHMAYLMGAFPKPNWVGAVLLRTVKPACTALGMSMRHWRAWKRRHAIIYSEG
jgi:hypothetical protein